MIETAVKILQDKGATDVEISDLTQDFGLVSYNYRGCAYGFKIYGLEEIYNHTPELFKALIVDKFNFLLGKVPQNG